MAQHWAPEGLPGCSVSTAPGLPVQLEGGGPQGEVLLGVQAGSGVQGGREHAGADQSRHCGPALGLGGWYPARTSSSQLGLTRPGLAEGSSLARPAHSMASLRPRTRGSGPGRTAWLVSERRPAAE